MRQDPQKTHGYLFFCGTQNRDPFLEHGGSATSRSGGSADVRTTSLYLRSPTSTSRSHSHTHTHIRSPSRSRGGSGVEGGKEGRGRGRKRGGFIGEAYPDLAGNEHLSSSSSDEYLFRS